MATVYRGRIGRRIVLSFVLLVLFVVGACGWVLYGLTQNQLDRQMSAHLMRVTQLIAGGIDGDVVVALRPEYALYRRLRSQLLAMRDETDARRIYVFDREGRSLIDTRDGVAFGQPYAGLAFDRVELDAVWHGRTAHSVRFRDASGVEYKTGYAPIGSGDAVVAAVGVEIGVGFLAAIRAFQHSVFVLGAVSVVLTIAVGIALGKTLTGPIAQLVTAARNIGEGNLDTPIEAPSRDELGYLGATMEEMRQQVLARDERLRQMLGGVAHEIRNPLGGIELYAGLIASDLAEDDPRREHILRVINEVRHLNQVITDFLTFARPAPADPEPVAVKSLVEEAAFLLAPEMAAAGVVFESDVPEDLQLFADSGQMKRVLLNLMKNAVQAMPQGGALRVRAIRDGRRAIVRVTDTGRGIEAAHLPRLFEPFFTTREQGSGLGLAIVQQVVSENRGAISVETDAGRGTTFEMVFPTCDGRKERA